MMLALSSIFVASLALFVQGQDVTTTSSSPKNDENNKELSSDVYTTIAQFGAVYCESGNMRIEIDKDQLSAPVDRYSLLDGNCKANVSESKIWFEYTNDNCGTVFEGNETHWIISNSVVNTNPLTPPMPGSILQYTHQIGTFRCVYPKKMKITSAEFVPSLLDYEYPMSGISTNPISFTLYTDKAMTEPIDSNRKLKLNTTIYAHLQRPVIGDTGTFITPVSCNGFSSADPGSIQPMLGDGCWSLTDYSYINHTADSYTFSFLVFGFVARGETVTMQCLVNTCTKGQTTKKCDIPKSNCDFDSDILLKKRAVAERGTKQNGVGVTAVGTSFSVESENDDKTSIIRSPSTAAKTVSKRSETNQSDQAKGSDKTLGMTSVLKQLTTSSGEFRSTTPTVLPNKTPKMPLAENPTTKLMMDDDVFEELGEEDGISSGDFGEEDGNSSGANPIPNVLLSDKIHIKIDTEYGASTTTASTGTVKRNVFGRPVKRHAKLSLSENRGLEGEGLLY